MMIAACWLLKFK